MWSLVLQHLGVWESRERRKQKDYDRELANEDARREEMVVPRIT